MSFVKLLPLALVLAVCASAAGQTKCLKLKKQNSMYGYNLARGSKKSVYFPLYRVGTQRADRDLGKIKLYNRNTAIIELQVTVTIGDNGNSTLFLSAMHTEVAGCGDTTTNDCVTDVTESRYPIWAVCQDFNFNVFTPPGLNLDMKLEGKFLVVSVEGDLVGKVSLPPIGCMPHALRHTITRIAYVSGTSLAQAFICN